MVDKISRKPFAEKNMYKFYPTMCVIYSSALLYLPSHAANAN